MTADFFWLVIVFPVTATLAFALVVRKASKPKHEHVWEIVLKTRAYPARFIDDKVSSGDFDVASEFTALELRQGSTSMLFLCKCGELHKEVLIGQEVAGAEPPIEKAG